MKILDCLQGSPEWIAARIGLPTASNFSRIVTPKGNPAAAADRYLADLMAEWWLGVSLEEASTGFMDRGTELEPDAVKAYEFRNDVDVKRVGLCLRDDEKVGASPDGLVGDDGLCEIKAPGASLHMMYLLEGAPKDYFVQTQGQLWITGRKWNDLYCHHPVFPPVIKRYERDAEFIDALEKAVNVFVVRLDAAREKYATARADYWAQRQAEEEADVPAQFCS